MCYKRTNIYLINDSKIIKQKNGAKNGVKIYKHINIFNKYENSCMY